MKVAVVGGGINGVMSAWALARRGCEVDLFEKGELMAATSSATSKMLHGGLRYLEHGHFGLVREALRERAWWIGQAPHCPAGRNPGSGLSQRRTACLATGDWYQIVRTPCRRFGFSARTLAQAGRSGGSFADDSHRRADRCLQLLGRSDG